MGQKTLYHPVSLHVIRGSLEHCGWKVGRLHQTWSSLPENKASYSTEITGFPRECKTLSIGEITKAINECFSEDITVLYATQKYSRKDRQTRLTIQIMVDIHEITPMEKMLEQLRGIIT